MIVLILIVGIFIAAFPLWLMVRALRLGVWNGRGVDVPRDERPIAFWSGIVMYAAIAAIILSFPLFVAWDQLR